MSLLTAVVVASLLGSLHCVGMCGPLVAFAVGNPEGSKWGARARLHAAYHGGRLATYALVGAICGLAGAALDLGGSRLGVYRAAAILAGGLMIGIGLVAVLRFRGVRLPQLLMPRFAQRLILRGQRAALAFGPFPRALAIGLLTVLLPCGWLYMFALVAAGTGSPIQGAAVMAAFWLGSSPVLLSLGIGVQALTGTLGMRIPLVTAGAIMILGLLTIAMRMTAPVEAFARAGRTSSQKIPLEQVKSLHEKAPPCCQRHVK